MRAVFFAVSLEVLPKLIHVEYPISYLYHISEIYLFGSLLSLAKSRHRFPNGSSVETRYKKIVISCLLFSFVR